MSNTVTLRNIINETYNTNFDKSVRKKDLCEFLAQPPKSTILQLFQFLGRERDYVFGKVCGHADPKKYYLINIFDNSVEDFDSGADIMRRAILYDGHNLDRLRDIISRNVLILYEGSLHVVREQIEQGPFDVELYFPYQKSWLLQNMRNQGFRVTHKTTYKEISEMSGVRWPCDNFIEKVSRKLDILYSKKRHNLVVFLSNIRVSVVSDEGDITPFSSLEKAGDHFGVSSSSIHRSIGSGRPIYKYGHFYEFFYDN